MATLGESLNSSQEIRIQRDTAIAFHDCLAKQGIDSELDVWDDANAELRLTENRAIACNPIDGMWASYEEEEMDPNTLEVYLSVGQEEESPLVLMVDGKDRSEEYGRCFEESGYFAPQSAWDPALELQVKTHEAEVTNKWAKCARENGYPNIADSGPPVADGFETKIEVVIPLSMTVEELRALLKVCPRVVMDYKDPDYIDPKLVIEQPKDGQEAVSSVSELHNTLYEDLNK
ncbi:MAG: hypothetical protein FWG16_05420 [Micrococcales bacterium]|nr:hypothetical protein [Micrococcales bacterium]